jgi:hypothetical protein
MVDTPVYILTSGGTFSAAEEIIYNLKNMKRAERLTTMAAAPTCTQEPA